MRARGRAGEFEYSVEAVVEMRRAHKWRRGATLVACALAALIALLTLVLSLLDSP
jgi:hypothetical protein